MTASKRIALLFLGALVLAGAYDAVRNLPVLSGCNFYSDCPDKGANVATLGSAD